MHSRYVGGNNLAIEEELCSQRNVSAFRVRLNAQSPPDLFWIPITVRRQCSVDIRFAAQRSSHRGAERRVLGLAKMSAEPLKPKTWGTSDVRCIS